MDRLVKYKTALSKMEQQFAGKVLKTKDVAEILKVTPRTVIKLVNQGKLAYIRINSRTFRFHLSEVARYMCDNRWRKTPDTDQKLLENALGNLTQQNKDLLAKLDDM